MQPVRLVVALHERAEREQVRQTLMGEGRQVVGETGDGRSAVQLAAQLKPDVIILGTTLAGMDGCQAAGQLLLNQEVAVVMLVKPDQLPVARELTQQGAAICLLRPYQPDQLGLAVTWATRERSTRLALIKRAETAERRLAERQVVEQAKALLMRREHLCEADAYTRLRRLSMQSRKSLGDVAYMLLLNDSLRLS